MPLRAAKAGAYHEDWIPPIAVHRVRKSWGQANFGNDPDVVDAAVVLLRENRFTFDSAEKRAEKEFAK